VVVFAFSSHRWKGITHRSHVSIVRFKGLDMWRKGLILIVGIVAVYALAISSGIGLSIESQGTFDFMQYWSAWHLISAGSNPYDASLMRTVQLGLGQTEGIPVMMWNPPWTAALLAPILCFSFERAAFLFFITQALAVFFVVVTSRASVLGTRAPLWLCGLIAVSFPPIIESFLWGQIGSLLALGVSLFLFLQGRKRFVSAGAVLCLLSVKPHLFLVSAVPGLIWFSQLRKRDAYRCGAGMATISFVVFCLMQIVAPLSVVQWLEALVVAPGEAGVVAPVAWQTATLSTWIRIALFKVTGEVPNWPMVIVPTFATIATAVFFALTRQRVEWSRVLCPILCVGLLTAGYGWLYDQSVLAICLIQIVCEAWGYQNRSHRFMIIGGIMLIEALAFAVGEFTEGAQHYFAWIPAAVLGLWVFNERLKKGESSNQYLLTASEGSE